MAVTLRFLIWLAALAGGAACAVAAVAAQLGRWSGRFDLLNHVSPFWLAGGLLGVAFSLLVARGWARWLGAGVGAVAVLAAGAQTGSVLLAHLAQQVAARSIPADAPRLKLIQFSFYHSNPDPGGAVDWLLAQDADVIVLQEGEGLTGDARTRLLAAYPHQSSLNDFILSRHPLLDKGRFEKEPRATSMYFNGGYAVIDGPGGPFTIVGVHYTWPWPVQFQARQRREFARYIRTLPPQTTIVSGDLNSTPWSFALQGLERDMGLARVTHALPTFPAMAYQGDGLLGRAKEIPGVFAFAPIDHVFAGSAWKAVSVRRGPKTGSDHYPIIAVLARVG
jgi:endonuclease/exonuclease/phosphatase (EEP) superfamily protein YafD